MDAAQSLTMFAAGAAGMLSMIKLVKYLTPKPPVYARQHIWPNGDKDEIIGEITKLKQGNLDRIREHAEILSRLESICERLDRARIV